MRKIGGRVEVGVEHLVEVNRGIWSMKVEGMTEKRWRSEGGWRDGGKGND